ncbi:hypothetical protein C2W62_34970 [Candidatus Entotheonella serta]|nr:hypothetical protein C2W62_34970 [Candidatus Entotheonella serta]
MNNGLNPLDSSDATADLDRDGLNNLMELIAGTDLLVPDTDMDGVLDGVDQNPLRDVTKLNYPNQHDNTLCRLYRRYPPWN